MDFSLSIGIDEYLYEDPTPFAENDAIEFDSIMKNTFKIENRILLLGSKATYTSIRYNFKNILNKIDESDRFFFFFAGHGINYNGIPYVTSYDCTNDIDSSCHNIVDILTSINKTGCQKSVFFIDACESTIQLGSRKKKNKQFSISEIEELIRSNTFSYVFSSCSHKGVASIIPEKKHGIWSFFLLQALSGKDERALKNGCFLTNYSLQQYLTLTVKNYCKADASCEEIQLSHTWGKGEGEFLIIEFLKSNMEQYKGIPKKSLNRVEFVTITFEGVKNLYGFIKGKHFIPKLRNSSSERYINDIASGDIHEHMNSVAKLLIRLFNLKKVDYKLEFDLNSGYFICPYCTYTYYVELDEDDLSQVRFTASLNPHDINKLIEVSEDIDKCFPNWFDFLLFTLGKQIDVENMIERLEDSDDVLLQGYSYEYEPDCSCVELSSRTRRIEIRKDNIKIFFKSREEVIDMLDSLKDLANQIMLFVPNYKLLE